MELYIILALLVIAIALLVVLLARRPNAAVSKEVADSERRLREELRDLRRETADQLKDMTRIIAEGQKENLKASGENQEKLSATLTAAVKNLQESNERKLDQMRETVDEKLQSTLSQRLDTTFKAVSEQLQQVYVSLGEMKELAGGVNEVQRMLSNVKIRGTWAEVQLGNILEQTLTADQYSRNVSIRNNSQRVEYAVHIPSRENDGSFIWLPIDSKFPQEDYARLCLAAENADKAGVEAATKGLTQVLKSEARTISELYIDVPHTTDFAILFLPTEGLYAEALRIPGLLEELQTTYHIMVCGPTTITAFLNTLRMGFRTLAIDKHAAEVWKVLGAAKVQYEKFEDILTKARRKIDEAGDVLDLASKRNGIIRKKLKKVEEVGQDEVPALIAFDDSDDED